MVLMNLLRVPNRIMNVIQKCYLTKYMSGKNKTNYKTSEKPTVIFIDSMIIVVLMDLILGFLL